MKMKFFHMTLTGLCLASIAGAALAEDYYSNQRPSSSGYTSTASSQPQSSDYYSSTSSAPAPVVEQKKEHVKNKIGIAISLPAVRQETIIVSERSRPHHYRGPEWIGMHTGAPLPVDAVVAGGEPSNGPFYVCRGNYHGGMHPGKLIRGTCNISWGGTEVSMTHYEVLVSRAPMHWVSGSYGNVPPGALEGGYEHHNRLFICQADYHGGTHTGKLIGQNCNFGWGGREILTPYYRVLVG